MFTDHRRHLFAFHPAALEPSLGFHKILKLIRWALFLRIFTYTIEHVPAELNILPDMMTRWMRGDHRSQTMVKRVQTRKLFVTAYLPTVPTNKEDWRSHATIRAQDKVLWKCLRLQIVIKMVSYANVSLFGYQITVKSQKSSFSPLHILGLQGIEEWMPYAICSLKSSDGLE